MSHTNILLMTDVYKMGHMEQYAPGTNKVYSYLVARSAKKIPYTVVVGYTAKLKFLENNPVTHADVDEFMEIRKGLLGTDAPETEKKLRALADLGYLPMKVKAVPEGTIMPVRNVIMTVVNTHDDFYWVPGFFESYLLKVWNNITVASYSHKLNQLAKGFAERTSDSLFLLPFLIHDFGYRGCSSEETAAISGASHLMVGNLGTDTIPAVKFIKTYYPPRDPATLIGASVPASEHSVMCSFGRENELDAFRHMLRLYPTGIVSIVSDTYNLWNVLTNYARELKDEILARDGKVVFRPDSGDPELIICGDRDAEYGSNEWKGAINLLDEMFGHTVNSKGFKELNAKVGLIYGDGMYFDRYKRILETLEMQGYATTNLVIGVGGLLLQSHSRDDQGFAFKATYSEINGVPQELEKDPITDPGKKSHKGLMKLSKLLGNYYTEDQVSADEEETGELGVVFENGKVLVSPSIEDIRERVARG